MPLNWGGSYGDDYDPGPCDCEAHKAQRGEVPKPADRLSKALSQVAELWDELVALEEEMGKNG